MKKHPGSLMDQIPASARALVEQFDETKRKGSSFEKQHVRQTFWVRRDLAKRVDELCKTRSGNGFFLINVIKRNSGTQKKHVFTRKH
ncbi:hypothetical protein AYW79_09030 [Ferroacidibacillus organovorans]|uniref:Uncharacterized protein n=1 Tax=Ferroacidibacillus organovorans TaxID=1765683 RepID=A0A853K9H9_9BACL|nr:hypothetical protein AYW79_09030 [Ferroacidibacillus organovorans]